MHHVLGSGCVKAWLSDRARNLGGDNGVDVLAGLRLVLGFQIDEDVRVGESSFLVLNDVQLGYHSSEDGVLLNVLKQGLQF